MNDYAAPALVVESPKVGARPHSLVRALSRGTFALVMVSLVVSIVMSAIYPGVSATPQWFSISLGLSFLTALATSAAALAAQVACWIGPGGPARLTVDATGVRVEGGRTRFIPRADIEAAWMLRETTGSRVEFRLRNGDVLSAATATPGEAAALLDAAELDPSRRALRMPLGDATVSLLIGLAASVPAACMASVAAVSFERVAHLPSAAMGFLIFALFGGLVGAAVRLLAPPVVSVGRDGLSVQEGRGSWFVTFEEVGAATYGGGDITLRMRDGRVRTLSTLGTSKARREALYARIAAGVETALAPLDLSARLTALDRNGRTTEAWQAALRELAAEGDGYRHAGLTRDEVRSALEDPRAAPERRIGAAFVLALVDPADAGTRVRVVAETVAHPPVGIAIERAAEGEMDEEVIAAANADRTGGSG